MGNSQEEGRKKRFVDSVPSYFYPGAWRGACESRNRASLCSKDEEVGEGRGGTGARQKNRRERKEGRDLYGPSYTPATGIKPARLEIAHASEKKKQTKKTKLLQNAVISFV